MAKIFEENERQTKNSVIAIKEHNEELLISAIQKGEKTLEAMGVVNEAIFPLLRSLEHKGAAVKILGGGGKRGAVGCLLCYHHEAAEIEKLCQPYGYSVESITLGTEGVRLEQ
jgi:mevalonate kinase